MTARTINLLRTARQGRPDIHYADGRRVSKSRYDEIRDSANRLDCLTTTRQGDTWHHRSCARMV